MKVTLLLSLVFHALFLVAQPFYFNVFDTQDGLLSTEISCLLQDNKGYLWVGTEVGLSRYDGYTFENFTTSDGLPRGRITEVLEVADGQLWVLAQKGIAFYDGTAFHPVQFEQSGIVEGYLQSLVLMPSGRLWVGGNTGVSYLDKAKWTPAIERTDTTFFHHFPTPYSIFEMSSDASERLYFGSRNHLIRYDGTSWDTIGHTSDLKYEHFLEIKIFDDGRIWAGTSKGNLFEFEGDKKQSILPPIEGRNELNAIIEKEKNYWILDDDGFRIIVEKGVVINYSLYQALGIKLMTCMTKDHEDNIWVGSNEGLIRITARDFELYSALDTLAPNGIYSIGERPDGTVLIASNHARLFEQKEAITTQINLPEGVSGAEIVGVFYDQEGALWLPTFWDGIFRIKDGKTTKYWYDEGFSPGADIKFGFCSKNNAIWLGHNFGLSRLSFDENGQHHFKNFTELQQVGFNDFAELEQNQLWFAGNDGLYVLHGNSIQKHSFFKEDIRINGLGSDKEGNLWVATLGRGIYQFRATENRDLELLQHFNTENGLSTNFLLDVIADDSENIWIGSYKGISVLRKKGEDFHLSNYNPQDGLIEKAYQRILFHKDQEGTIWAATTMGLMSFKAENIHFNPVEPLLNLDKVLVEGEAIDWEQPLVLPYHKNSLSFEFTGISLKNPSKISYRYLLENAMKDWSLPSQQHQVDFNALSPGQYVFKFMAANNDQVWNSMPYEFPFEIQPPFWQRWWFILTVLGLAAITTFVIVKRREQRIKTEERERGRVNQMIAELETRALRAQMNPHFIFNCLNAIQECILTEQIDAAYTYLFKFSRLLRRVLESSAKSLIPVAKEIEILTLYLELEALRFDDSFEFEITLDESEDEVEDIFIPSLMIQPFVENSIWHGLLHKVGDRKVVIDFAAKKESLICTITDNGIGREAAAKLKKRKKFKHQSLALQLISDRLKIIQQQTKRVADIQITDNISATGEACGTSVRIQIPDDLIPERNN